MRSPVLFISLLSSLMILGITHVAAVEFSLYWKYPRFDFLTHFLGGVSLGLCGLLLPSFFPRLPHEYRTLLPILLFTLVVGVVWEIFEFYVGITTIDADFAMDTGIDFVMALLGATLGYSIGNRLRTL